MPPNTSPSTAEYVNPAFRGASGVRSRNGNGDRRIMSLSAICHVSTGASCTLSSTTTTSPTTRPPLPPTHIHTYSPTRRCRNITVIVIIITIIPSRGRGTRAKFSRPWNPRRRRSLHPPLPPPPFVRTSDRRRLTSKRQADRRRFMGPPTVYVSSCDLRNTM